MLGGHWGSKDVRPTENVDYCAHVMHDVLGMEIDPARERPAWNFELSAYRVGPFAWARGITDGAMRIKRGQKFIGEDGDQYYFLYQTLGPASPHVRDDIEHNIQPGEVLLGHSASGFQCLGPNGYSNRMLWIPKPVLAPLLSEPHIKVGQVIPPAHAGLVSASLGALWDQAAEMDNAQVAANLHGILGLIAAAAGAHKRAAETVRDSSRNAVAVQAKLCIDRWFWRGDLSPDRVAAMLGISTRQLHRAFAPTGQTFAEYLAARRIERARWLLTNPAFAAAKIADIAWRCGFDSLATFHRTFRAGFGCAPGEMRDAALNPRAPPLAAE